MAWPLCITHLVLLCFQPLLCFALHIALQTILTLLSLYSTLLKFASLHLSYSSFLLTFWSPISLQILMLHCLLRLQVHTLKFSQHLVVCFTLILIHCSLFKLGISTLRVWHLCFRLGPSIFCAWLF
jgi:hypothetical protein